MFAGTYTPKVDAKGRLFIPAKFRDEFEGGLVVTRGQEKSLYVQTKADFDDFADRLRAASQTNPRVRGYSRMLFSQASTQQLDGQGRISITPELREYAGLEREAVVVGVLDRVEIWRPETWEAYTAEQEQAFADFSDELFPGL